ncbi:MAG: ABC transporter substrate-binding protein [Patescibacteria group bacterium]
MKFSLPKFNYELFQPKNINFSVLGKPKLINKALKQASPITRTLVILEIGILIASLIATMFGVYLAATKDVVDPSSEVNEAVVLDFSHLSPIFEPKNSVEERITKMLFMPLYTVEFDQYNNNNQPVISTKTLIEKYTWAEDKPSQKIIFKLKPNLTFSNSSKITSEDVKYTFDKIKEISNGNKRLKYGFKDLTLNVINELEYEVLSEKPRFSMIYDLNFAPVSKGYNELVPTANLYESEQTKTPMVTSGYFKISKSEVSDIDYSDKKIVQNPIKTTDNTSLLYLKLDKFISNNAINPSVASWNIKKYDQISSNNLSQSKTSIEKDYKINKIDLFIREYAENGSSVEYPQDIKDSLTNIKQDFVNSNWYMTGYFNARPDISRNKPATKQDLRTYLSCSIAKAEYNNYYTNIIQENKKYAPIQIPSKSNANCTEGLNESNFKLGEDGFYSFNSADPKLDLNVLYVGFDADLEKHIIDTFQNKSKIRTSVTSLNKLKEPKKIFSDSNQLATYDLILFPTQINNSKLQFELLNGKENLLGFLDEQSRIEELHNEYLSKNTSQTEADNLTKFFTEKAFIVNLFNYKTEINHNFKKNVNVSKNGEINYEFTGWYTKTIKDWFFR